MFYRNRARAEAKKLVRKLKGNISYPTLERYIEKQYKIVFYNTEAGDAEIERYGLEHKTTLKAFTLSASAKIIFIDGSLHTEDRLYVLLHEIGHIVLGHIGDGRLMTRHQLLTEYEADSFAYEVLIRSRRCTV